MVEQINTISNTNYIGKTNASDNSRQQQYKTADYPNDSFVKSGAETKENPVNPKLAGIAALGAGIAAYKTHQLSKFSNKLGEIMGSVGKDAPASTKQKISEVGNLVAKDGMTGLGNKISMQANVQRDYNDSIKGGKSFAVGMIDMDNFKGINEVFDHSTGDTFIKQIAKNISEAAKKHDAKAYRYGGEEFVLSQKNGTPEKAKALLEDISERIKNDSVIQGHKDKFVEKIENELSNINPDLKLLDDSQDVHMFNRLHNAGNLTQAEHDVLKSDIKTIISKYIENYKPANKAELQNFLNDLDKTSAQKPLNIRAKVGDSSNIGKELNKIFNQYKSHKPELEKWLNHVKQYDKFTVSGGFTNVSDASVVGENGLNLVAIADEALNGAKNMGKNCVVQADDLITKKALDKKAI